MVTLLGKKKKGKKGRAALSGFEKIIAIVFPMVLWAFVMFSFQSTIVSIPIFNLLITLGGFQTYNQGVIGGVVIILIVGVIFVTDE